MSKRVIVEFVIVLCLGLSVERVYGEIPLIGAEVIIEPGQTNQELETWFKSMKENGMSICRIRIFEEYVHFGEKWNFALYDHAFILAEKYGIKIFATLFPLSPDRSIGGFKFPLSQSHEDHIKNYIFHLVNHYKNYRSLYGWVLMNEPGTGGSVPNTKYTKNKFAQWEKHQAVSAYKSGGYPLLKNFDKQKFLTDYNTWYLRWIAEEILKYDTRHRIHVNNHQIFENIAEYDFPSWREFLTSLGASAHPSWHFGYFKRSQYTVALSANCNIIRSGAGNLPYYLTELQGGNNTYSGGNPFCPSDKEITQWLWTGIATGVRGIIFWSLNSRSIGEEAGEWALLDFQNNASGRLKSIKEVVKCLDQNRKLFSEIKPMNSQIYILYNRPSLWIEKEVQYNSGMQYEGREPGGVIKSALSYYEILCENGIVPNMGEFGEFDWNKANYDHVSIILANTISLPSAYWDKLRNFVRKGGKLFVEGITGFYDENMLSLYSTHFPLEDVFGGSLKEVVCQPNDFTINIGDRNMPAHLWEGHIYNKTGTIIGEKNGYITATINKFGEGEVIWAPSLLGLGARRSGKSDSLSDFLMEELNLPVPIRFERQEKGVFMQTSKGEGAFFSIIINKNNEVKRISITSPYKADLIFSDGNAKISGNLLKINPEESVIIKWK